jgi:hypothetical protein
VKEVSMAFRLGLWIVLGPVVVGSAACGSSSNPGSADAGQKHDTGAPDAAPDHHTTKDATPEDAQESSVVDAPPEAPPLPALSVIIGGDGTGTVTSVPAGIDCPTTCSHAFSDGTTVTLTASPDMASSFTAWSGACSGTGPCAVTFTGQTDVTASFNVHPVTTWDPTWSLAGVIYSNGNLSISGATYETYPTNVRTTLGVSSGSYYWEVTTTVGDGETNLGGLGIAGSDMPNDTGYIGEEASGFSFGYGSDNATFYYWAWAGVTVPGTPPVDSPVDAGIVYMFALDMDDGNFWVGQNGVWYSGDPSTATSPVATGINGTVYPAVTFYNYDSPQYDAYTANFGATAFKYPVPTGFTPGFY